MARPAFSVRFPPALAEALDTWAAARQSSRSDLVEAIITATTAEDRVEILQAPVTDAPTERLNLRLSPAARAHLAALAGDLPPADFLRRTVAALLRSGDWIPARCRQPATASSPRTGRRSRVRATESSATESTIHAPFLGLAVLVLMAAAGLVIWFLVQALIRVPGPSAPPHDPDSRGQLDDGMNNGNTA